MLTIATTNTHLPVPKNLLIQPIIIPTTFSKFKPLNTDTLLIRTLVKTVLTRYDYTISVDFRTFLSPN